MAPGRHDRPRAYGLSEFKLVGYNCWESPRDCMLPCAVWRSSLCRGQGYHGTESSGRPRLDDPREGALMETLLRAMVLRSFVLLLSLALAVFGCRRPAGAPDSGASAPEAAKPSRNASASTSPARTTAAGPAQPTAPVQPSRTLTAEERLALEKAIEEAYALEKANRHDEALALLLRIAGQGATNGGLPPDLGARIVFARGEVQFRKGRYAAQRELEGVPEAAFREAVQSFQELLRLYPNEEKAGSGAYLLGSSYLMLDEWAEAQKAYQHALDAYPRLDDRPRALLRVGVCQAAQGEAGKAIATFRRLLREFPDSKADVDKAQKYLRELSIVGRRASPIAASQWLLGIASHGGVETFSGEVIVLVFFATWCENCSEELPHLRQLIRRWSAKGVVFLGIANPEDPKNTKPIDVYAAENRIDFSDVALDRTWGSWGPYQVSALPAAVLVDRKGIIRWRGHPAFFPGPLVDRALGEQ